MRQVSESLAERASDLQDQAAVSARPDFRRLMRAACLRLGQLVNQTELGRDVARETFGPGDPTATLVERRHLHCTTGSSARCARRARSAWGS